MKKCAALYFDATLLQSFSVMPQNYYTQVEHIGLQHVNILDLGFL